MGLRLTEKRWDEGLPQGEAFSSVRVLGQGLGRGESPVGVGFFRRFGSNRPLKNGLSGAISSGSTGESLFGGKQSLIGKPQKIGGTGHGLPDLQDPHS